jgi:threonine/homoserine/homoserine lactone efflux protein
VGGTFGRALATCLLNPKAYVFMLAVFPQFLRAGEGALLPQVLLLGAIIAAIQLAVYGGVALGAEALRVGLVRSAALQVVVARCVALLLLATAAWTVWHGWSGS